jgi:hypothetical protein
MKGYIIFLLLAPLAIASGKISYFPATADFDVQDLKCLKNAGDLDYAFTMLTYESSNHLWTATTSPERINSVETKPDIILDLRVFWKVFSVDTYSSEIAKQFTNINARMIWLAPSSLTPTSKPTCANILEFAKAINAKTGLIVGIFSNRDLWTQVFGSPSACPELVNLFLFNYEFGKASPASFGAWSRCDF